MSLYVEFYTSNFAVGDEFKLLPEYWPVGPSRAPTNTRGFTYRIMYELAVCSDGMSGAKPRLFRQNRPARE